MFIMHLKETHRVVLLLVPGYLSPRQFKCSVENYYKLSLLVMQLDDLFRIIKDKGFFKTSGNY